MFVWLSFQSEEALFAAVKIGFYVTHDQLPNSMTALRSASDEGCQMAGTAPTWPVFYC